MPPAVRSKASLSSTADLLGSFALMGWNPPSIIDFCIKPQFLNRPNLYPRQATLLKVIFLQTELLTDYDYSVIEEWTSTYVHTADEHGEGNNGMVPDVLERMRINRLCPCGHDRGEHLAFDADGEIVWDKKCHHPGCCDGYRGRRWFRQTSNISGRRGSKGHIGAQAGAYVLWNYMGLGDPQAHFGVDRDKPLTGIVFAGKKDQALKNQWGDLNSVILGGPCFSEYISKPMGESLSVYAPWDKRRVEERRMRGIQSAGDMATFQIVPKESTLMAGRGPASFMQFYDEMAHVVATGANRSAEEVYGCLDPSTRVLKADLTWVPIDSLEPGDALVALDEQASGVAGSPRKLREATVVNKWNTEKVAYRITLEDGSSVICSGDHRWLRTTDTGGGNFKWATINKPATFRGGMGGGRWAQLRVGDAIRHLVDPWSEDLSREGGYLSGIFDGEGHVRFDPRNSMMIGFAQNPGLVRDYVISLLEAAGFSLHHNDTKVKCQSFEIQGVANCFRFLGTYRPLRLMQNARNFWQGRAVRGQGGMKRVVSIDQLPVQRLVDIETTTGTFIAEGLVSHNSATPSLDQFKEWAFLYIPTSPWQKIGQSYIEYQQSIEVNEDGSPAYPEKLMVQLTSWDIYKDWEIAHTIESTPGGLHFLRLRGAIQAYDDQMRSLERANPETFNVERRSHWATAMNAYLNADRVKEIWQPWPTPAHPMKQETRGILSKVYRAHGDPSKSGAGFGFAMAHIEDVDERGLPHVVFDRISAWNPADFPNHEIDYDVVGRDLEEIIDTFMPGEMTFDQFNSVGTIQRLQKYALQRQLPKRVTVYERTATGPLNWKTYETFKTAVNMGLVHGPYFELADLELTFLQDLGGKVEKPSTGPVQTKDVADCYSSSMEVLTEQGWMLIKDVPRGIKVATRSPEGRLEYQEPTDYIARHYKGVMYEYDGTNLNFSVTPGHRMLVQREGGVEFIEAQNLTASQYRIPKTAMVDERTPNTISFDTEDTTAALRRVSGRGGARNEAGWTQEQDDYLREHYVTTSMADLCAVLGKTRGAIYNRAKPKHLDLKRGQIGDRIGDRPAPLPETKVEDFAAFLGIWLAEGRKMRDKPGYDVKITQTKPDAVGWIDNLFSRLPWPVTRSVQKNGETVWVVKSQGLREYLRACQGEGHELLIPDEVFQTWTRREMESLLEGLMVGDGAWSSRVNRHLGYYSTSKRLVDGVQRLLAHLGQSGYARIIQRTSQYRANHDLWYVSANISQYATLDTTRLKQVEYDDMVYCLTVPNSTLLVRRNGVPMWAGNCMAIVVYELIGNQMSAFIGKSLSDLTLAGAAQGGFNPYAAAQEPEAAHSELSSFGRRGYPGGGRSSPARGGARYRGSRS